LVCSFEAQTIKQSTMKKILFLLVAAYVGVLVYEYYRKVQTVKIWNDPKWQYCLKILYNNDFSQPTDTFRYKWKDDLRILTYGKPTIEDKKSLEKYIAQFNELIFPRKITLCQYQEPAPGQIIKINANIFICFRRGLDYCPCKPFFFRDSIPGIYFINSSSSNLTMRGRVTSYTPSDAWLNIFADSSDQTKRDGLILKGLTYVLLCFDQPEDEWIDHFDANGHLNCNQGNDPRFPNSIFNSNCGNCNELTDVDKYIIKTFYSHDLEKRIEAYSPYNYLKSSSKFFYIELAIVIAIFVIAFFTGYFKHIFSFFDNHIRLRWLAFNSNILFVTVIFSIVYTATNYITYHIYASGIVPKPVYFDLCGAISFMLINLKFWIAYVLIPVNCIYLIEKEIFPKFNQFAQQQLFSFIALVASISILIYLLKGQKLPMYLGVWWVSLSVSTVIGIARFLYNYTTYQKKLAVMDKEQEISKLRELKTRAELNALQSKINPHFLYNALNSIAGLAHENANKVEQMALALSKLFRYSINKEDDDFTTVQNEVEMVSIYLDIEKVRFGDKLQYRIALPEELEKERIPKFIIQPLVENAIKHGISQITSAGMLTLEISKRDNGLKIMVSDNGPDFPEDLMTGYGLQNIYEKLDILYPGRYEVTLRNGSDKNISIILKSEQKDHL
jgi:sensor histidine kinase YesM